MKRFILREAELIGFLHNRYMDSGYVDKSIKFDEAIYISYSNFLSTELHRLYKENFGQSCNRFISYYDRNDLELIKEMSTYLKKYYNDQQKREG